MLYEVITLSRLAEIDALSIRPLRAKLSGLSSKGDDERLESLEEEAKKLRKEL